MVISYLELFIVISFQIEVACNLSFLHKVRCSIQLLIKKKQYKITFLR